VIVPKIGMTFQYEKDAYEMYTYDGSIEFGIRKSDIKNVYIKVYIFKTHCFQQTRIWQQ
jgi:hypothetical protein